MVTAQSTQMGFLLFSVVREIRFRWPWLDARDAEARFACFVPTPNRGTAPHDVSKGPAATGDHVKIKMNAAEPPNQRTLPVINSVVRLFVIVINDSKDAQDVTGWSDKDSLHAVNPTKSLSEVHVNRAHGHTSGAHSGRRPL